MYGTDGMTPVFSGDALLQPTEIYVKCLLPLLRSGRIKAAAHITGGGLPGNVCRVLSQDVMTQIDADNWTVPPVFGWLSQQVNLVELQYCLLPKDILASI